MPMGLVVQSPQRAFGIMGIGYDSDESIAFYDPNSIYPNVVAQLVSHGYINTLAYSLWLNDLNANTGSILFGGVDTDKFHGGLMVLPIQPSTKSSYTDLMVALSTVTFTDAAGKTLMSQSNLALPVILDSGTSILYLPESVLNPILSGLGVINDNKLGLILPCSQTCSSATLNFGFGGDGGPSIAVPLAELLLPIFLPNGYPRTFPNGQHKGEPICNIGVAPGDPGPYLFGDTFLRSAYVVYDLTNNQIAIAQTNYNATSSNIQEITENGIPGASSTALGTAIVQTSSRNSQTSSRATSTGEAQTTSSLRSTFLLCGTSSSFPPSNTSSTFHSANTSSTFPPSNTSSTFHSANTSSTFPPANTSPTFRLGSWNSSTSSRGGSSISHESSSPSSGISASSSPSSGISASGSPGSGKSPAVAVVPPKVGAITVVSGLLWLVLMVFGGSLVILM